MKQIRQALLTAIFSKKKTECVKTNTSKRKWKENTAAALQEAKEKKSSKATRLNLAMFSSFVSPCLVI